MKVSLLTSIARVAIALCWILFILTVAGTYLPHNPFTPSGKMRLYVLSFCPQGWGFFTKNTQDPDVLIYAKEGADWHSILRTPNSSVKNAFGLMRDARSQGVEYGVLLTGIQRDSIPWLFCQGMTAIECFENNRDVKSILIRNTAKVKTICGEAWVVIQKPIPWAWSKSEVRMPIQFLRLNVICDE